MEIPQGAQNRKYKAPISYLEKSKNSIAGTIVIKGITTSLSILQIIKCFIVSIFSNFISAPKHINANGVTILLNDFIESSVKVGRLIFKNLTRNPASIPIIIGFFIILFNIFFMGTRSKSGNTPIRLALAGAAISALFTAISQAIALTNGVSQSIFGWNNSGLQASQMSYVYFGLPCLVGGLILSVLISPKLTILNLGDEVAISLGEKVNKIKLFACFIVLILTGGVITLAGSIGYVGLIIPHMVRRVVGSDYKWIVPYSIVGGALVTLISDILARSINPPYEVPINAITSVIGVPFFLYLLLRKGGDKL